LLHDDRELKTGRSGGDTVHGETKERWRELCERVVAEKDPVRFEVAIQELLEVLEEQDHWRLNPGLQAPLTERYAKVPMA
jgi:hypothetical protein